MNVDCRNVIASREKYDKSVVGHLLKNVRLAPTPDCEARRICLSGIQVAWSPLRLFSSASTR